MAISIKDGEFTGGVPGIGTDFLVAGIERLSDSSVRVWYTQPPLLGTGKANDATNYAISGPAALTVSLATATSTDSRAIDLYFNKPLTYGQWTITFNRTNITSATTSAQLPVGPTYIFDVVVINQESPGLSNDANLVRKFFNPAFLGQPAWEAVIAGLGAGNDLVANTVNGVFDQLYISSAQGKYLGIRSANYGISKPSILGLVDDAFRNLSITLINEKLTENANLDLLEIIYGPAATHANITSALQEPFALFDKATLTILTDGKQVVPVVFSWTDFVNSLRATANEVCAAINKNFLKYKCNAFAATYQDPLTQVVLVRLYSGTQGLRSSICVTSGSAQTAFQFDQLLYNAIDNSLAPAASITVSLLPLNKAALTFNNSSAKVLSIFQTVVPGDYINILGSEFSLSNRGSFVVEKVSSVPTKTITISNSAAVGQTVSPISTNSVSIWRPSTKQIYDNPNYALVNSKLGESRVSLPVNTEIVVRDTSNGAYLSNPTELDISDVTRLPDGTSILTTANPPLNQFGIISGFLPKLVESSDLVTQAGSAGVSNASYLSCASSVGGYKGILARCVTDFKNNNIVFGGRDIDAGTDVKSISKYAITGRLNNDQLVSHTYTWSTTSNSNVSGLGSSAVLLDYPRFWNKILVAGGYPNGPAHAPGSGYAEQRTFLYSADSNAYTEITGTQPATPIADAGLIWNNVTNKAYIVGGIHQFGQPLSTISAWDPSYSTGNQLGQWSTLSPTLKFARSEAKLANLGDGSVLVIGGRVPNSTNTSDLNNVGYIYSSCEKIYVDGSHVYHCDLAGGMGYSRFACGVVNLPGNRVLVVGGIGHIPDKEIDPITNQLSYELKSCEIYDAYTGYWSPIPDTLDPHSYCSCHYVPELNRVYVCGGASSTKIEYLDLETMTWRFSVTSLPTVSFRAGSTIVYSDTDKPIILRVGGSAFNGLVNVNTAYIAVAGGDIYELAGDTGTLLDVNSSHFQWSAFAVAPNGDIYAAVNGGDVYKQAAGTATFVALGQTPRNWTALTVSISGSVYAAVAGNDIYQLVAGAFVPLGQGALEWFAMAAAPNGDIYAAVNGGDIYRQYASGGSFLALGQTLRNWTAVAVAASGSLYGAVAGDDIYKLIGGTLTALGQGTLQWSAMMGTPGGDIYAAVNGGDLYKQTLGAGNFVALEQASKNWTALGVVSTKVQLEDNTTQATAIQCYSETGRGQGINGIIKTEVTISNLYGSVSGGSVFEIVGDAGTFTDLSQANSQWSAMAAAPSGDIYAAVNGGDLYKQTAGTGLFVALGQTTRNWTALTVAPNGGIYAAVAGGDIYQMVGGVMTALGQGHLQWSAMADSPAGDIYAAVNGGDVYKQTLGAGNFLPLGAGTRNWTAITVDFNGTVYAAVAGGTIYQLSLGTFQSLNQPLLQWSSMTNSPNGDIYADVNGGDVYVQVAGTIGFVALGLPSKNWTAIASTDSGIVGTGLTIFDSNDTGYTKSDHNYHASFMSLKAEKQDILGPYIYDTNQPFGLNGDVFTLKTTIPQGKGCPPIEISGDTTSLPVEGYLVAHYGFENQTGPFKYFIRDNPASVYTVLIPDPSFNFPEELNKNDGIELSVASQIAAFTPSIDIQPGAFYVTASNAGLTYSRKYIEDISAAGIDLLINVRYPGDRGLGNEGLPWSAAYKLSDIIEVFGPDELDAFLEEERNVN